MQVTGQQPISKLNLDQLRFFLSGDDLTVHTLYELIFNNVTDVMIRRIGVESDPPTVVLPPQVLKPVGFSPDEGMLPYGTRSFLGYRLLTEYFTFPSKFLFVDLCGLGALQELDLRDRFEVYLFLDRTAPNLEPRVEADTFRMGCGPVVNLFTKLAEPIRLTHTKTEYHVIPDVRRPWGLETYSVDSVDSVNPDTKETIEYKPFFSFQHAAEKRDQRAYWYAHRRASVRRDDPGTEVYLSLVDLDFNPRLPPVEVLNVYVTCSNRDLPGELRAAGGVDWQFQLQGQAPLKRITPLVGPTKPARLPFTQSRWRLVSHLSLNHLSITGGPDGASALREILKLYDYSNTRVSNQHIDGVADVTSRRTVAPINDGTASGFCRGVEVTVEFDEEKYVGTGCFLLASVLERFLGLYTSINSFTRVIATSKQREGFLKRWPPRTGERTLA
jgi:type VI secretion system protein ImpG